MRSQVAHRTARVIVALLLAIAVPFSGAQARETAPARKTGSVARKPAEAAPAEPSAERRKELQSEQRQLRQRLSRLKRQLAEAEASQSDAADGLAESEAAISTANRRLRELSDARRQIERQIAGLQERGRGMGVRQAAQEAQLSRIARQQFLLTRDDPWRRVLAGDSPASLERELRFLTIAAGARAASIGELRDRREDLQELESESLAKQAELSEVAKEEKRARGQLLQQQSARKKALARLSRQISSQRQTISSLERDERRLSAVVEEINRVLAEQAREAARRAAAANRRSRAPSPDAQPPGIARVIALMGKLQLPVRGEILARFGSARRTEAGVDAPTWKGVFIRAPEGVDVRVVAAGRVVFADWLRGFGNLLIVDHGEGLLSVYGNNESLLRSVGDKVQADEVVAAVGNTGGNPESGLYFELRYEGRPIDPLKWAQAR